jgi:hypothetical protein
MESESSSCTTFTVDMSHIGIKGLQLDISTPVVLGSESSTCALQCLCPRFVSPRSLSCALSVVFLSRICLTLELNLCSSCAVAYPDLCHNGVCVFHHGAGELQLGGAVSAEVCLTLESKGGGVQLCPVPPGVLQLWWFCSSCSGSASGMSYCGIKSEKIVSHRRRVETLLKLCHIRLRCVSPWLWICPLVVLYPLKVCLTMELEHFLYTWELELSPSCAISTSSVSLTVDLELCCIRSCVFHLSAGALLQLCHICLRYVSP